MEAMKKQLGIDSSKSIHPSWKASFRYHWFQITLFFYKCRHVSTITSLARISQQKFQCCTCLRSAAWRASEKFEAGLSASWRGSCSTGGCGWPEFEGLSQWGKTWSSKKWAPISTRKKYIRGKHLNTEPFIDIYIISLRINIPRRSTIHLPKKTYGGYHDSEYLGTFKLSIFVRDFPV
jgi:hypothetical protein